jgi:RNA polymerase sigma factor (sigma-70 family)
MGSLGSLTGGVCAAQKTRSLRVAKNEERYLLQALEFEGLLRACLYRYTRNSSDVEELLQETYARLLTAGSRDEPEVRSVRGFALTIARNVAFDWLRHRQMVPIEVVADMEALEVLDESEQIDEIVNGHQELALLVSAVQDLPERSRQVFTLRKVYGYSQREIASRLQISENTVEQHLTRAARRCAEALFDQPPAERHAAVLAQLRHHTRAHADSE